MPAYQNDVKVVLNNQSKTPDNINDLIDYYNSTLQNFTDKYAPLQCKNIALRPWYMSALRREKRTRRRGERVAAQTQLEVDRQIVQNMYRGFIKFVSRWWKVKVGGGALRPGMGH